MTSDVHYVTQDRGAPGGPPLSVRAKNVPDLQLGLLAAPSLLERLRRSLSASALLPDFDPKSLRTKEWRQATIVAVGAHVVFIAAIGVLGWRTITVGDDANTTHQFTEVVAAPFPDRPSNGEDTSGGGGTTGGGNHGTAPTVPAGLKPLPPLPMKPLPTPVIPPTLPVAAVDTPVDVPSAMISTAPGLPDAPAVDDPSAGGSGTAGGSGSGSGGASSTQGVSGNGSGNGTSGTRATGGSGTSGPSSSSTSRVGTSGTAVTRGARLVSKAPARVPQAMIDAGVFGTVKLWITIGPTGSILQVEPSQPLGYGGTQAAIDAAYRCRFLPALKDGQPVTDRLLVSWEIHPR